MARIKDSVIETARMEIAIKIIFAVS